MASKLTNFAMKSECQADDYSTSIGIKIKIKET